MDTETRVLPITDKAFGKYGKILKGYDCSALLKKLTATPRPDDGTVYVASDPELEKLDLFRQLQERAFGGLPMELGYCNGNNIMLNALEYHRSSEIDIAANNLILLLGSLQDVDRKMFQYDTGLIEAFLVPAGAAVELYATTLHYAPCDASENGFRAAVALPRGTNLPLELPTKAEAEDRLLFARNKWLIAHPQSGLESEGAFIGLVGKNRSVEEFK